LKEKGTMDTTGKPFNFPKINVTFLSNNSTIVSKLNISNEGFEILGQYVMSKVVEKIINNLSSDTDKSPDKSFYSNDIEKVNDIIKNALDNFVNQLFNLSEGAFKRYPEIED
jgi:alanine-alpha-ketoisovalerate/valine-pyruvate aminotransferase